MLSLEGLFRALIWNLKKLEVSSILYPAGKKLPWMLLRRSISLKSAV
jgi:hypothetical protein